MSKRVPFEQSLALGREQLSTLLDAVRELVILHTPEGNILFANASVARVLGYRPEELGGASLFSLIHEAETAELRSRLGELRATPEKVASERCRLRAKDGSWRWFEAT